MADKVAGLGLKSVQCACNAYSREVKHYFDEATKTKEYTRSWMKDPVKYYHDKLKLLSQYSGEINSLLDIGCGSGQFLQAVQKAVKIDQLFGIDVSKGMFSFVSPPLKRTVSFLLGDSLKLPFKAKSFDCVCMDSVLHHVIVKDRAKSKANIKALMREVRRVIKPNGFLFLSELYYESFGASTLTSNIVFSFLAFFDKLGIKFPPQSPKGLVVCFYTRSELRQLVTSAGGTILKEQVNPWKVLFMERLAFLRKRGAIGFFIQFTNN